MDGEDQELDEWSEGDEDDDDWPEYDAAFDAVGRRRCMHEATSQIPGLGRCHGCLADMRELQSCDACFVEICNQCRT